MLEELFKYLKEAGYNFDFRYEDGKGYSVAWWKNSWTANNIYFRIPSFSANTIEELLEHFEDR